MKILGVIPSRYESTRFPGKPLANILGKSMIERVYKQCLKCSALDDIIVATDDKRIYDHVLNFGGKSIITSKTHQTGTERCNEVAEKLEIYNIIINIQGDEPLINPVQIDEIIALFNNPKTQIGTLAKKIHKRTILEDENTPKAIIDNNRNALNFCRKILPSSNKTTYYQHVGIYGYRKEVLNKICKLPKSKNEIFQKLEQMRWLDNDYSIKVGITNFQTLSVDTPDDIKKIISHIR